MKWIPIHITAGAILAYLIPNDPVQDFSRRLDVFVCYIVIILAVDVLRTSEENAKLVKGTVYFPRHSWSPLRYYIYAALSLLCLFILRELKGSEVFIWLAMGMGLVLALWGNSNRRVRQKWMASAIQFNVQHLQGRE